MAGQTGAVGDPDVIAEGRLDDLADDLIRGAMDRQGLDRHEGATFEPDGPRDLAPMAWDLTRFAAAFKLGDLDWIADSALKYTGE